MRVPGIIHINSLDEGPWPQKEISGRWVYARPLPFYSPLQRWKAAWLVFTGKADALKWRNQ